MRAVATITIVTFLNSWSISLVIPDYPEIGRAIYLPTQR